MQTIKHSGIIKSQVKSPKDTPAPKSPIVSMTFWKFRYSSSLIKNMANAFDIKYVRGKSESQN